uniref:S1 motif domain-containing protein n=1 Tax=Anopheles farauti TaxID=69004 RepID=A0A182QD69_9DIPT
MVEHLQQDMLAVVLAVVVVADTAGYLQPGNLEDVLAEVSAGEVHSSWDQFHHSYSSMEELRRQDNLEDEFNREELHLPGSLVDELEVEVGDALVVVEVEVGHNNSVQILHSYSSREELRQQDNSVDELEVEVGDALAGEVVAVGHNSSVQILRWYSNREELHLPGSLAAVVAV